METKCTCTLCPYETVYCTSHFRFLLETLLLVVEVDGKTFLLSLIECLEEESHILFFGESLNIQNSNFPKRKNKVLKSWERVVFR